MTLADTITYGGYVSAIKLAIYIIMFFTWMPLVNWVHQDTQTVRTDVKTWTSIIAGTGALTLIVWLFAPLYLIGLVIYLVGNGATSLAYVIHRNARVADFEKVLTIGHIKSLFVNENKHVEKASRGIQFITANNNEVPLPEPKSPESFGFKTACNIFDNAIWRRASNVVFQPTQSGYTETLVIDGIPTKQEELKEREEIEYLLHYLKQLADLDVNERRKPQTGPFKVVKDGEKSNWELTTAGSTAGEHLTLKKIEEYNIMKLDDIGLTPSQVEAIKPLRDVQSGLCLLTGPKHSGTTTTLYAMIKNHDPFLNNINTLEKRPAAEIQNITQHTFKLSDTGTTTFSKRLQSILRMGPDIMGIGDLDDKQSAFLACKASKDGKIIHVTMGAGSVMQALQKWIKLVEDRTLIAETLLAIVNQRLVRKLCDNCKEAYQPNPELLRKFNLPADKIKVMYRPGEVEYDKRGRPVVCEHCQGTGYYGRVGIFETIVLTDSLKDVIRKAKSMQEIAVAFRRAGMLYMQEESIKKVAQGVTSINEVIREFSNPQKKPQKK